MGRPSEDITGQIFNGILVKETIHKDNKIRCICVCFCGRIFEGRKERLKSGITKSCGCIPRNISREKSIKHGKHLHPLYQTWCGMHSRCYNEKQKSYERYGGRGIRVCERWHNIENFITDMGLKPSISHTLERIDNDLDYSPENCEWATLIEQANNKRNSRLVEYNNETKTVSEWARIVGIQASTISYRILHGWTSEDALTIKPKEKK